MGQDLLFEFVVVIVELTVFMLVLAAGAIVLEVLLPKFRRLRCIIPQRGYAVKAKQDKTCVTE